MNCLLWLFFIRAHHGFSRVLLLSYFSHFYSAQSHPAKPVSPPFFILLSPTNFANVFLRATFRSRLPGSSIIRSPVMRQEERKRLMLLAEFFAVIFCQLLISNTNTMSVKVKLRNNAYNQLLVAKLSEIVASFPLFVKSL